MFKHKNCLKKQFFNNYLILKMKTIFKKHFLVCYLQKANLFIICFQLFYQETLGHTISQKNLRAIKCLKWIFSTL